ncbi:hypothetical protein JXM67_14880 [candidate division WOR-3 bacterium]|nr:hypothetical protein [candidate division WOR-3 bacterium]
MLEILAIIFIVTHFSKIAQEKGYPGRPFSVFGVCAIIFLGIVGAVVGVMLTRTFFLYYIFWLIGAALGFLGTVILVESLKPRYDRTPKIHLKCDKCGATTFLQDEKCRFCGAPASVEKDKERLMIEVGNNDHTQEERSRYVIRLSGVGREIAPFLNELYQKEQKLPAAAPLLRATLAVALYKIQGEDFLPEVEKLKNDPFPVVRDTAVKILASRIKGEAEFPELNK